MTRWSKIKNRESAKSKTNRTFDEKSRIVGAAMREQIGHSNQERGIRRAAVPRDGGYEPTHKSRTLLGSATETDHSSARDEPLPKVDKEKIKRK